MIDKVIRAQIFAHNGHDSIKQTRKYGNNDPYWVHTDEVAAIVSVFTTDPNVIAAAHLHDLVEDVNVEPYTIIDIALNFSGQVALLVRQLTDAYPSSFGLNRAARKDLEARRLGCIDEPARLIKLADLFSNTRSIVWHDRGFARTYLKEKELVLFYMQPLSLRTKILYGIVKAQLALAKLYLWVAEKTVDRKAKKK